MPGSNIHSFVLSQIFGLYFVIVSIIFLSRAEYYKKLIQNTKVPTLDMTMQALLFLLIAIALVIFHNVWVLKPRVMVTIVCWFFLIRSIMWLASPEKMLNMMKKLWAGNAHRIVFMLLMLFGMLMTVRGFCIFVGQETSAPLPDWVVTLGKALFL